MKEVVERLQKRGMLFRSFSEIPPKALGSRQRIGIFLGVDLKDFYTMVIHLSSHRPLRQKELENLKGLHLRLEQKRGGRIVKCVVLVEVAPSKKMKQRFKEEGWIVFVS